MIPSLTQILEGFRDGIYTLDECLRWIAEHSRMDAEERRLGDRHE